MQLGGKWGFIDKSGATVLPFTYSNVTRFNNGVCAVLMSGKWGFIHHGGSAALPARWEKTGEFAEGLCPVKQDGKWGLIDSTGTLVQQPTYDEMDSFDSGHILVALGQQLMYLDSSLRVIWKAPTTCPSGVSLKMYKAPA